MLKKTLRMIIILYVLPINGMEKSICYLTHLPIDVQDRIFVFVTCDQESDEECFKRIEESNRIPLDLYRAYFPNESIHSIQEIAVFNPLKTKIAVYKTLGPVSRREDIVRYQPRFVVIDLEKNKENNKIYDEKVNTWNYEAIAVSPHATMIAAVYEDERDQGNPNKFLMIKSTAINQERRFPIAKNATIVAMDFNKQGTSISVHSRTTHIAVDPYGVYLGKYHKNKYTTFSLKIMKSDDPKVDEPGSQKIDDTKMCDDKTVSRFLLRKYFMEKSICKQLQNINLLDNK